MTLRYDVAIFQLDPDGRIMVGTGKSLGKYHELEHALLAAAHEELYRTPQEKIVILKK